MNSLRAVNNSYQGPLHGITDFDNNYKYVGTDPRLGGRVRPSIRMEGGMSAPGAPGNVGAYAGLPETINEIERQQQEYMRRKFEYDMNPENQPKPYNPETNPFFPDFPFGRPTGTGNFAQMLPPIDPAAHKNKQRNQKLYNKGKGTDNPNEADAFLRRTGPQLPLAAVGADQQPAQGPFTPIRNYPGMGYGPYGPGGGGMQPMPMRQALIPPVGFNGITLS